MKLKTTAAVILAAATAIAPANAGGFMTIPDIAGESQQPGKSRAIEIESVSYAVEAQGRARVGAGRARARATPGDFTVAKKVDAASPYIALAAFQQKSFADIEIEMTRPAGAGAERQYYTITLTNARIAGVETNITEAGESTELVKFFYEAINIQYFSRSGDQHEIEYDVASGV